MNTSSIIHSNMKESGKGTARVGFGPFLRKCCLVIPALLMASPLAANEEETFDITFRTYPLGEGEWRDIYYKNGDDELTPVRFTRNRGMRSQEHEYEGSSPLVFYRLEINEEGKEVPVPKGYVELNRSGSNVLLMFEQIDASLGYRQEFVVHSLEEGNGRFPADHLYFFNGSEEPILGIFGGERFRLEPRQSSGPHAIPEDDAGVQVAMAKVNGEGELVRVVHNRWRFSPGRRELIVLTPSANAEDNRLNIFHLSESAMAN